MRRVRTTAGDVFEIPLPEEKLGYGQIILGKSIFYATFFERIYSERPATSDLLAGPILLVGWTVNSLIRHGRWTLCERRPPDMKLVPFPSHKIAIEGRQFVESFDGKTLRPATADDWQLLDFKSTVAPIRYQKALSAHHGLGPWENSYLGLTVGHARERIPRTPDEGPN